MIKTAPVKSSFTLPPSEVSLVARLKRRLHLASNTAVIRKALLDLQAKVERQQLREQFRSASKMVLKVNREEMEALDHLAGENLNED